MYGLNRYVDDKLVREERNILALGDFFTLKKSLRQTRPGRRP